MVLFNTVLHQLANPSRYSLHLGYYVLFHSMHFWCDTKPYRSNVCHRLVNYFLSWLAMFNAGIWHVNVRKGTIPKFQCKANVVTCLMSLVSFLWICRDMPQQLQPYLSINSEQIIRLGHDFSNVYTFKHTSKIVSSVGSNSFLGTTEDPSQPHSQHISLVVTHWERWRRVQEIDWDHR